MCTDRRPDSLYAGWQDLIDIIERATRDAHWLHEWYFYITRVKVCIKRDGYERIREAIRAIRRWLRKTNH